MSEQKTPHRIRLARQADGITIEVWIDDEGQLRDGLLLLGRLCKSTQMELIRQDIESVWIREGPRVRIRDDVTDSVYRVALSVLEGLSQGKRVTDIQTETGLSQGSVSNILAGRQGGAGDWFQKQGENWALSDIGISKVLDEVVPAVRRGAGQEAQSH